MPSKYPEEFRQDVIRVAMEREPDVTLVQIAKDFGIHVGTLDKWLRQARIEAGEQEGTTRSESAELRELLEGATAFPDQVTAYRAVFRWANRYNTRRRHSAIGQITPHSYEDAYTATASANLAEAA